MAFIIYSYPRLATKSHFLGKFESQGKVSISPFISLPGIQGYKKKGTVELGRDD